MSDDLYYLQDSRNYVGNDMLFHAIDGKGYVTDMRKAHVFSKDEAAWHHAMRSTDIPWPKEYIDARTRPAVDMQHVKRDEALAGTGIVIAKPAKDRIERERCESCGCFLSAVQRYCEPCPKCGADSKP